MKQTALLPAIFCLLLCSQAALANPNVEEFLNGLGKPQEKQNKKNAVAFRSDEYLRSPLVGYLSREEYDSLKNQTEKRVVEGKMITINTGDPEGCEAVRLQFNLKKEVCVYDPQSPLVSVVVMKPAVDQAEFEKKISYSKLSKKTQIALKSLGDFTLLGSGAFGIIYALPESISKWDKSRGFSALAGQWQDRVNSGPVVDEDDWAINYIGHPISGAYYYTLVRHQGFSRLESAAFSFCMSTFFWEYGIEAFAEVPSVQDLILTPLIGSIIGEVFYNWENNIEANDGKLLGSAKLGKTATILMNPAGAFADKVNSLAKYKLIDDIHLSMLTRRPIVRGAPGVPNPWNSQVIQESYFGLKLNIVF